MPGRMEFDFQFSQPKTALEARKGQEGPLRMLVLGDFSARSNRGLSGQAGALADRPVVAVDVDNLDDVLFRFAPELHLPLGDPAGPGMSVGFQALDDFHPDALYRKLALFKAMRETRARLQDPKTYREVADALKGGTLTSALAAVEGEPAGEGGAEDDSATIERLLGRRPVERAAARPSLAGQALDLDKFIREIVTPHIVPGPTWEQAALVTSVDQAIGEQMRVVLHHPAFQALEALWRSVQGLVTRLEMGEMLKLFVLDVTKEELAADTAAAGVDLQTSGLYRALVDKGIGAAGGEPWSLLVADFTFGTTAKDMQLLAALGAVASRAGGPILAAADAGILGCRSLRQTPDPADWTAVDPEAQGRWQALRQSGVASWVGLALPRVLLRLPYGGRGDAIESFDFEELPGGPVHEQLLWGNPAFVCANLIGQAFLARGWRMEPGDVLDLDDLPGYVYREAGESVLYPCGEAYLSERAGEAILVRGLMPVLSHKNRNAVRVMRFQSIAVPPTGLAGPWA